MSSHANKELLEQVFAETAKGNGRPFVDALAEEVRWTILGTTAWSRTYSGKRSVAKELLGPLNAQLDGGNLITATRFICEGELVVVEGQGHNRTRAGTGSVEGQPGSSGGSQPKMPTEPTTRSSRNGARAPSTGTASFLHARLRGNTTWPARSGTQRYSVRP